MSDGALSDDPFEGLVGVTSSSADLDNLDLGGIEVVKLASGQRFATSRCRQRSTASARSGGTFGVTDPSGFGSRVRRCVRASSGLSASNGRRPETISYATTPSEHRSDRGPVSDRPDACSGDM